MAKIKFQQIEGGETLVSDVSTASQTATTASQAADAASQTATTALNYAIKHYYSQDEVVALGDSAIRTTEKYIVVNELFDGAYRTLEKVRVYENGVLLAPSAVSVSQPTQGSGFGVVTVSIQATNPISEGDLFVVDCDFNNIEITGN